MLTIARILCMINALHCPSTNPTVNGSIKKTPEDSWAFMNFTSMASRWDSRPWRKDPKCDLTWTFVGKRPIAPNLADSEKSKAHGCRDSNDLRSLHFDMLRHTRMGEDWFHFLTIFLHIIKSHYPDDIVLLLNRLELECTICQETIFNFTFPSSLPYVSHIHLPTFILTETCPMGNVVFTPTLFHILRFESDGRKRLLPCLFSKPASSKKTPKDFRITSTPSSSIIVNKRGCNQITKLFVQRAWGHYILWEYVSLLRNPRCFVGDDSRWKSWKRFCFDFACHGKAGPQQCGLEVTVWVSKAHWVSEKFVINGDLV